MKLERATDNYHWVRCTCKGIFHQSLSQLTKNSSIKSFTHINILMHFPLNCNLAKFSILYHRFQVYSCISILKVYASEYNCGIVELQGSNGEKANCFFTAKVFYFKNFDAWPIILDVPNTIYLF